MKKSKVIRISEATIQLIDDYRKSLCKDLGRKDLYFLFDKDDDVIASALIKALQYDIPWDERE